ncbi:2-alkenal reductase (NADP(+)-dependent)-like isoform X2 [Gossypium australe]|uniref:2-alkenal reductase (NADP(+)-dependent)-like isoform X2 n=1 Tax=Gossypium australe TaxID=47621 RepID=A0A5B6UW85_9ROSI|nr:2-alkenal reductase (NADP(+)-dependent)-like isoform X2 [Gossypium australe]
MICGVWRRKGKMAVNVVESKEWYLAGYAAEGVPTTDHLTLRSVPLSLSLDSIPDAHVAVQLLFISVDPYLRTRMSGQEDGLYFPQFNLNQYCVVPSSVLIRKIDPEAGIPLPEYLSCLGVPGFAAWVGIEVLGEAKPGSNAFISAAAGGVGMVAGQLAKLKGCRVIGSTGSDAKVRLVKEEFGYDDAFNYNKETDFDAALSKYFPNGIDIYLENVGGKMLEAVLNHVNPHARIPVCGMISQYNQLVVLLYDPSLLGFQIPCMMQIWTEREGMEGYLKQSKISSKIKIYEGIQSFAESLGSLFSSSNFGKVVIEVNKPR